jgi:hypothetical protein
MPSNLQPLVLRLTGGVLGCLVVALLCTTPAFAAGTSKDNFSTNPASARTHARPDLHCMETGVDKWQICASAKVDLVKELAKPSTQARLAQFHAESPQCFPEVRAESPYPAISGTPKPGYTITVSPGTWYVCGGQISNLYYHWSNGNQSQSYVPVPSDVGQTLSVVVEGCDLDPADEADGLCDNAPAASVQIQPGDPPPTNPPTLNYFNVVSPVDFGTPTTISFSVSNTRSSNICHGDGGDAGWNGWWPASFTYYSSNLTETTTYTATCYGPSGDAASWSQTVQVNPQAVPTVTLTASSYIVNPGTIITVSYTATAGAQVCHADSSPVVASWNGQKPAPSGPPPATQSQKVTINVAETLGLTCTNTWGTSSRVTVNITIADPANYQMTLQAKPGSVYVGTASTLYWTSNASSCQWSWGLAEPPNGSMSTGPLNQDTTVKLYCSWPDSHQAVRIVTVKTFTEDDPCFDGSRPGGLRCELAPVGGYASEKNDPGGCLGIPGSPTPDLPCGDNKHCAWFETTQPLYGRLAPGVEYHAISPHVKFHYCLAWGLRVGRVDGITADNNFKRFPWEYSGTFGTSVGGLHTPITVVTVVMHYRQCITRWGCFDSRNVVIEVTIDANASDRAHPWTIRVSTD